MNSLEKIYDKNYIDKIITQKFSSQLMSNSKWIKLIRLLVENYKLYEICEVKLIYDDEIRKLVIDGNETQDFDYYKDSMEGMITNPLISGWVLYKEIEWLSFPIESNNENLIKLKELVDNIGHFQNELTKDYYRIIAYLK